MNILNRGIHMIFTCEYCGKEYKTYYNRSKHHYCSTECSRKAKKNVITVRCDYCGKCTTKNNDSTFKKHKHHFCSLDCANNYQKLSKKKFVCKICGKDFYRSPSWIKQKAGLYCSMECRNKDEEWKEKTCSRANQVQCNKLGPNKLEVAGNKILDSLGLEYQTQFLINNKICVDAYVPRYNLVIQWDGNYWHGKGLLYEQLDDRQKKRRNLDISQDAYLKECGFNELRFWEDEVYKESNRVYENIQRTIQQITKSI